MKNENNEKKKREMPIKICINIDISRNMSVKMRLPCKRQLPDTHECYSQLICCQINFHKSQRGHFLLLLRALSAPLLTGFHKYSALSFAFLQFTKNK